MELAQFNKLGRIFRMIINRLGGVGLDAINLINIYI